MKVCTGCPHIKQEPICERYVADPSEISPSGSTIFTGYCGMCGHSEECHQEISKEELEELNLWQEIFGENN